MSTQDSTTAGGRECRHYPEWMHLMTGETADETFVFEPKSVICGNCGRSWSVVRPDAPASERWAREALERIRDFSRLPDLEYRQKYGEDLTHGFDMDGSDFETSAIAEQALARLDAAQTKEEGRA